MLPYGIYWFLARMSDLGQIQICCFVRMLPLWLAFTDFSRNDWFLVRFKLFAALAGRFPYGMYWFLAGMSDFGWDLLLRQDATLWHLLIFRRNEWFLARFKFAASSGCIYWFLAGITEFWSESDVLIFSKNEWFLGRFKFAALAGCFSVASQIQICCFGRRLR